MTAYSSSEVLRQGRNKTRAAVVARLSEGTISNSTDALETRDRRSLRSTDLGLDLISNASGQYDCSPTAINGTPRCQKDAVDTAASSEYTSGPMYGRFGVFEQLRSQYWVAFLRHLPARDRETVTMSDATVNGFKLHCIEVHDASLVGWHLKLCTTPQGILGLINDATLFELQRYSTSPAASRFRIPTR